MTHRRRQDSAFRQAMWEQRFAPHVGPINRLVNTLSTVGRTMPYVAPNYGGGHKE